MEDDTKQVGAVITFPPGYTVEEVRQILARALPDTARMTVHDFNPAWGEPVWYIP